MNLKKESRMLAATTKTLAYATLIVGAFILLYVIFSPKSNFLQFFLSLLVTTTTGAFALILSDFF